MEPTQNRPSLPQDYDSDSTKEKLEKDSVSKVAKEAINLQLVGKSIKQKLSASIKAGSSKCYYVFDGVLNDEIQVKGPVDPGSFSSNLLFGHLNKNKFCGEGAFTYPFGKENVSYSGAIKDGKLHGQGKLTLPEGNQLEGPFVEGKLHGQGKRIYKDGRVFEGQFEQDRKLAGKLNYPDGASYEGGFLNETFHGWGKLIESNGDVYEGRFVNGKIQGKGKLSYENGAIYEGEFVDGNPRGKGKMTCLDGMIDEGEFVGYHLHGEGRRFRPNGAVYEGSFVKDNYHGEGTLTAKWGAHIGLWENGRFTYKVAHKKTPVQLAEINSEEKEIGLLTEKIGSLKINHLATVSIEGKQCYLFKSIVDGTILVDGPVDHRLLPSGRSVLYGHMIDGKFSGEGTIEECFHQDFSSYSGAIKEGLFHGKGKLFYANGDSYEGDFIEGCMEGKGRYVYANGDMYEGEFAHDERHGEGALSAEWGAQFGLWENDKFTYKFAPRQKL